MIFYRSSIMASLLNLPNDVLRNHIFVDTALDPCSLGIARMTCRRFQSIVSPVKKHIEEIVQAGHLCILLWAISLGAKLYDELYGIAVRAGHLEMTKWLFNSRTLCNMEFPSSSFIYRGYIDAAILGDLEIFQWMFDTKLPIPVYSCVSAAAYLGHLPIIKLIYSRGLSGHRNVCNEAARGGHLEVLQFLNDHGTCPNSDDCVMAAKHGHLKVLQWLRSINCTFTGDILIAARDRGHADVYNWVVANGVPRPPNYDAVYTPNR
jgi:hypothetical protein